MGETHPLIAKLEELHVALEKIDQATSVIQTDLNPVTSAGTAPMPMPGATQLERAINAAIEHAHAILSRL